mmetsp:Transcript_85083/g.226959  ORF Transcript_85083/g.226959 Transcript_85083/m.226959 type:complete len:279 (-) Transcript_85083:259-1095(-)
MSTPQRTLEPEVAPHVLGQRRPGHLVDEGLALNDVHDALRARHCLKGLAIELGQPAEAEADGGGVEGEGGEPPRRHALARHQPPAAVYDRHDGGEPRQRQAPHQEALRPGRPPHQVVGGAQRLLHALHLQVLPAEEPHGADGGDALFRPARDLHHLLTQLLGEPARVEAVEHGRHAHDRCDAQRHQRQPRRDGEEHRGPSECRVAVAVELCQVGGDSICSYLHVFLEQRCKFSAADLVKERRLLVHHRSIELDADSPSHGIRCDVEEICANPRTKCAH